MKARRSLELTSSKLELHSKALSQKKNAKKKNHNLQNKTNVDENNLKYRLEDISKTKQKQEQTQFSDSGVFITQFGEKKSICQDIF